MREGVLLLHGIGRTSRSMRKLARALAAAGTDVRNHDYPSRRHELGTLAAQVAAETAAWRLTLDRLHLVTHSMGGLLARILVARHGAGLGGFAPEAVASAPVGSGPSGQGGGEAGGILGRTVMLAPPNGGSEIADLLMGWRLYRRVYGPAGQQLGTAGWGPELADCLPWPEGAPLLILAGTRSIDPLGWWWLPKPNDGKVSVARTRLDGAEVRVVKATHALMMLKSNVIRSTAVWLCGEDRSF